MSAEGIATFERHYAQVRQTLPWLPAVHVTDDLPEGSRTATGGTASARVGAMEASGRVLVQLSPSLIPSLALVAHEAGHVLQRALYARLRKSAHGRLAAVLSQRRQAEIVELRVLTTRGPESEGFAALVCEAFLGQLGGYYAEDVPTAQALLAVWFAGPRAVQARTEIVALNTWTPSAEEIAAAQPVVTPPTVTPTPPDPEPAVAVAPNIPSVLLHDSHSIWDPNLGALRSYGGAPGEGAYIRTLNDRLTSRLLSRGLAVTRVPGDLVRHAVYSEDFDLFFTPHYDADIYHHVGGWFTDRAATSLSAAEDDRFRGILERRYRALPGVPVNISRSNANTYNFHAFRWTTANTPGVIIELGVGAPVCNGHGYATAPDHGWLRANIDLIADVLADSIEELVGIVRPDLTPEEEELGLTEQQVREIAKAEARAVLSQEAWLPDAIEAAVARALREASTRLGAPNV